MCAVVFGVRKNVAYAWHTRLPKMACYKLLIREFYGRVSPLTFVNSNQAARLGTTISTGRHIRSLPIPLPSGPIVLLLSYLSLSSYPVAWMQGCQPPQAFASARLSVNAFTLYSDLALATVGFRNSLRRRRWFPFHRRPFRDFPV